MHVHPVAIDIPKNTVVGGRLTADIVVLRVAVHRHGDGHFRQTLPFFRERNHSTGHQQRIDAAPAEFRQDTIQLTMAHHRLATDKRDVQRLMLINQLEDATNQLISAKVTQRI